MMKIVICGGSGFIGRHLAAELARRGYTLVIPVRDRERVKDNLILLPNTHVIPFHIGSNDSLSPIFKDADIIINLVGILNEDRYNLFDQLHVEFVRKILELSAQYKISRLIHISALGAEINAKSNYLKSKANGEYLVKSHSNLNPTIIRPSVVCGTDGQLINQLAKFIKIAPKFLPLPGAYTAIQPIVISDFVSLLIKIIENPTLRNKEFNIGGPEKMTLHDLTIKIARAMNSSCKIIPLNKEISWTVASICDIIPFVNLFTKDNYHSCSSSLSFNNNANELLPSLQSIDTVLYQRFGERESLESKRRLHSNR